MNAESSLCSRTMPTSVTSHASSVTRGGLVWCFGRHHLPNSRNLHPAHAVAASAGLAKKSSGGFECGGGVPARASSRPCAMSRFVHTATASASRSTTRNRRPSRCATAAVVPEPGEPVGDAIARAAVTARAARARRSRVGFCDGQPGPLAIGMVERLDVGPPVLGDLAGVDRVAIDAAGLAIGLLLDRRRPAACASRLGAARGPHRDRTPSRRRARTTGSCRACARTRAGSYRRPRSTTRSRSRSGRGRTGDRARPSRSGRRGSRGGRTASRAARERAAVLEVGQRAMRRTHRDRRRDRRSEGRGRAAPCRCRTAGRCRSRRAMLGQRSPATVSASAWTIRSGTIVASELDALDRAARPRSAPRADGTLSL